MTLVLSRITTSYIPTPRGSDIGRPSKGEHTLSKEEFIEVALTVLDRDGVNGLSFRSLARHLGVTPMAVMHHVGTRHEMLKSVVARVYDGVDEPPANSTPHDCLRALLSGYCKRVLAHPNVAILVLSDPLLLTGPLISLTEKIRSNVALLVQSKKEVDAVLDVVVDYTHGFAIAAASAQGQKRPTLKGFQRGLDWILNRI